MRPTVFATAPLLAALMTSTAAAQVTARVHIDIPIGRREPVEVYRPAPMPREVTIYDYDRGYEGRWDRDDYRDWQTVTVYLYGGRYYERPYPGARRVVIYRYRDRYFFPPNDRAWQQRYGRDNDWGRRDDRDDRYDRNDRYGRNDRDDRDHNNRNDRDDRGGRPGQGQDNHGGGAQGNHGNGRGAPQVPPGRGGRSRP